MVTLEGVVSASEKIGEIPLGPGSAQDVSCKAALYRRSIFSFLCVLLLGTMTLSFLIGRFGISFPDLLAALFPKWFATTGGADLDTVKAVLFQIRVPRIVCAAAIGAALSVSGAGYQGIFRNPMVSPDILGASSGSGFGAALAILLSFDSNLIQLSAFLGGLLAVLASYALSQRFSRGGDNIALVLVLTGMVISALFVSFTSLIKYLADPDSKLPAITFWLMGGLASVSRRDMPRVLIPLALGAAPLIAVRWRLNILSFSEDEARSLGLDTRKLRCLVILCSTLLTSAAISVGGLIGWVGLVIPHLARLIAGPNYKTMLPVSLVLGATYLLIVDDVARNLIPMEIPLGILTSLIGAPFFIYLMAKNSKGLSM